MTASTGNWRHTRATKSEREAFDHCPREMLLMEEGVIDAFSRWRRHTGEAQEDGGGIILLSWLCRHWRGHPVAKQQLKESHRKTPR